MKKINVKILLISGLFLIFSIANATYDDVKLDYKEAIIVDSDLDGLTDQGEKEIFKTDPLAPDSDMDGFYDGTEILTDSNALDNTSPAATKTIVNSNDIIQNEIPWGWYVTRATGLVAFLLLYLVMFLGLSIKTPLLNKLIKPINSLNVHTWLSVQALFFVFVHMGALLFDKYLNFGIYDITVPFISKLYTNEVALGILGMYLMVLLIVNSYFRKFISYKLWRFSHYLNIVLYIIVVAHGFFLGTDLKNEIVRNIFIGMNLFLMMIIVVNIITKIINYFKLRNNSHL